MIYETLNAKIAGSIKAKSLASPEDKSLYEGYVRLWRSIKTEMTNAIHSGIDIPNDANEIKILKSMIKQRRNACLEFEKATGENALINYNINKFEADAIEQLLPKATDPEDVKKETMCVIKTFVELKAIEDSNFNIKMLQRYTKDIISKVKEKYSDAENGVIAKCIQEYLAQ